MSVLLGVPRRKASKNKSKVPKGSSASYVGGHPIFLESPQWPQWPLCGICGQRLAFVAKIYAPIDRPRALFVFGCRRGSCSAAPDAWHVWRQNAAADDAATPELPSAPKGVVPPAALPETQATWGDSAWGEGDAWGDASTEDDQIEKLLSTLEQSRPASKAASRPSVEDKVVEVEPGAEEVFPCTEMEILAEPEEAANGDLEADREILAKALQFLETEEDAATRDVVRRAIESGHSATDRGGEYGGDDDGDGDDDDDEDEEDEDDEDDDENGDGRGDLEEKGDGNVTRRKEGRGGGRGKHGKPSAGNFHGRLRRAPTQLLRYNWDGQPLLEAQSSCAMPDTANWSCERCGAPRGFECQLMPNVLNVLEVDSGSFLPEELRRVQGAPDVVIQEGSNESRKQTNTSQKEEAHVTGKKLELRNCGDYMDFTTVCIYSCSESCQVEGRERVFVQP